MKEYKVTIIETIAYHVTVKASDKQEADDKAMLMTEDGSILPDGERIEIYTQDIKEVECTMHEHCDGSCGQSHSV